MHLHTAVQGMRFPSIGLHPRQYPIFLAELNEGGNKAFFEKLNHGARKVIASAANGFEKG